MNKNDKYRIGVDLAATAGKKSGLGFYVENIVRELNLLPGDHEIVEINKVTKDLRTPQRILWDKFGIPFTAARKKIDTLYVPAFSTPRIKKPVVMTAHDIFGVIHPDHFQGPARYYWSHVLPNSMKKANHLICISEHTKKEIQEHLQIPDKKMSVINPAASDAFRVLDDMHIVEKQLNALGINGPFVLSVGTIEPRKNFQRLVEAFTYAKRQNVKLVLVGKKGWNYDGVFEKIRKFQLQQAIIVLDYVSQEQLVALYNACLFLVMPSLYEGFGLPALEAMQCGAPVAVSQNTSLPEVVGNAGVLFNPYEVESIRERINLLIANADMRQEMSEKSLKQATHFSWKKSAASVLNVLNQYRPTS